mmetsp:Transcript_84227/g.228656  ORF Transcript_84227/g.228656 Transcript_84227/m.228656 type:complete len:126 (+) Transcript_84227:541-918(+)
MSRICCLFCSSAISSISLELRCFLLMLFLESRDNRDSWLISEKVLIVARCCSSAPNSEGSGDAIHAGVAVDAGVAIGAGVACNGRELAALRDFLGVASRRGVAAGVRRSDALGSVEAGRRQGWCL